MSVFPKLGFVKELHTYSELRLQKIDIYIKMNTLKIKLELMSSLCVQFHKTGRFSNIYKQ